MFQFPPGLYCDVRIERLERNNLVMNQGALENQQSSETQGAFIRIFDGSRWYCSSLEDVALIQRELDSLARMAKPRADIASHPLVRKYEVHKERLLSFVGEQDSRKMTRATRLSHMNRLNALCQKARHLKKAQVIWTDEHCDKSFFSSLGSEIHFDQQKVGLGARLEFAVAGETFSEDLNHGGNTLSDLGDYLSRSEQTLEECSLFIESATSLPPGAYCTVLSPMATGIFAHESFGHKSEADLMSGSPEMRAEWELGRRVCSPILSIADDGSLAGTGRAPFDDEGTKARRTWLIKDGLLAGRLHSADTAHLFAESPTGNARAKDFDFEPIVRMTSTFVEGGKESVASLFAPIRDGVYVKTVRHGSGMSTFTIAPARCYRIRDGKIAEPLKVAVVSGSVFETLHLVDGVADDLTIISLGMGGCGKMEQSPLPVSFGGPHIRVAKLNIQ